MMFDPKILSFDVLESNRLRNAEVSEASPWDGGRERKGVDGGETGGAGSRSAAPNHYSYGVDGGNNVSVALIGIDGDGA